MTFYGNLGMGVESNFEDADLMEDLSGASHESLTTQSASTSSTCDLSPAQVAETTAELRSRGIDVNSISPPPLSRNNSSATILGDSFSAQADSSSSSSSSSSCSTASADVDKLEESVIMLNRILDYRREATVRATALRARRAETLHQNQSNEQERRATRLQLRNLDDDLSRQETELGDIDFELESLEFQVSINARTERRLRRKIESMMSLFQERQEEAHTEANVVGRLIDQISKTG